MPSARLAALLALAAVSCVEAPAPLPPPAPTVAPAVAPAPRAQAAALAEQAEVRRRAKDYPAALDLYGKAWDAGARDDEIAVAAAGAAALGGSADGALSWLDRALEVGFGDPTVVARDADFAAVRADPRFDAWRARCRERADRWAKERRVGEGLAPSTPEAEGLSPGAVAALRQAAEKAGTSALVLVHDGRLAGAWYFGGAPHKIEAMSATKSVVALAVGAAIDDGKIPSLDAPVWTWFPEWRQGKKERITLRMLLNHTSGLQAGRTTEEIYRSPDFVQLALAAELTGDPGAAFFYNNKAVNLLPEIVARATGQPFEAYVRARLFTRLGIEDVRWSKDRTGHAHGMSGLQIQPLDLAKIGQMLLDGGTWKGQRVIPAAWIQEMTRPGQRYEEGCGLLWWLRHEKDETSLEAGTSAELEKHGLPAALAARIRPLEGAPLPTGAFWKRLNSVLGDDARKPFWRAMDSAHREPKRALDEAYGYEAEGYLGQYMLVIPRARLVAVRMVEQDAAPQDVIGLHGFDQAVLALTRPASAPRP